MPDVAARIRTTLAEFRRRRIFRVAAVYLVVAWIFVQVADATFQPLGFPEWASRLLIVLLGLGFVLACCLSWIYDLQPHGLERTPALPDGNSAAATDAAPARRVGDQAPPEASVAILPFTDLSESHDQDYFCDGLAEEILNALARVRGLHVASRTASFRFRDGSAPPSEIGRQLQVAAIMEGSVRKAGDRVRITAQLVNASNGYHLWSENFDRNLEDIFSIQEEIARNVVNAVRPALQAPPAFDLKNPNRARALLHAFALYNPAQFHAADGSGYRFIAEQVVALDRLNPQVASRLARAFDRWRKYDEGRQGHARAALESIRAAEGLSGNVGEVVGRSLA